MEGLKERRGTLAVALLCVGVWVGFAVCSSSLLTPQIPSECLLCIGLLRAQAMPLHAAMRLPVFVPVLVSVCTQLRLIGWS